MKKQIFAATLVVGLAQAAFAEVVASGKIFAADMKIEEFLPRDGSSCDPSVIAANVERLNNSGVLQKTAMTDTVIMGHCYGLPCRDDVPAAVRLHCAKAGILQKLVNALDAE
ncbi:MAG: hypothetical protein AB7O96_09975 [Pseudobdellovibrionaceae bacterium]